MLPTSSARLVALRTVAVISSSAAEVSSSEAACCSVRLARSSAAARIWWLLAWMDVLFRAISPIVWRRRRRRLRLKSLTQAFPAPSRKGWSMLAVSVAVGKAGEALGERRDGGVQRLRIGKLGSFAARGVRHRCCWRSVSVRASRSYLFDGCKAEAFGGTGHFADLVAALRCRRRMLPGRRSRCAACSCARLRCRGGWSRHGYIAGAAMVRMAMTAKRDLDVNRSLRDRIGFVDVCSWRHSPPSRASLSECGATFSPPPSMASSSLSNSLSGAPDSTAALQVSDDILFPVSPRLHRSVDSKLPRLALLRGVCISLELLCSSPIASFISLKAFRASRRDRRGRRWCPWRRE